MKEHILLLMLFVYTNVYSQVGIGTKTPQSSAMLELSSSSKGFLPSRISLTGKTDVATIASPATGLLIYNTATAGTSPNNVLPGYYYFNGSSWVPFATGIPDATVEFGVNSNPNTTGTTFTPNTPQSKDYVYVSAIDGSQWTWNGSNYIIYIAASTPFYLNNTTSDAGNNKTSGISRPGWISIGKAGAPEMSLDVVRDGTAQYQPVARFLCPTNTIAGNNTQLIYGVSQSYGNAADWRFYYAGNGNAKNRIDFGWSGIVTPSMSYLVNGNVGINMTDPLSRLDVEGAIGFRARLASSSTSQTAIDGSVIFNVAGAVYTLEAPSATTNKRRMIVAKNASTGNITVTGHIDGVAGANLVIPAGGSQIFHTEGTSWYSISDNTPNTQAQVSARANRGNDVTLDNLKFRVAASGNASLQVSTVTGTVTLNGTSTSNNEAYGLVAGFTATTTPTYIRPSLTFANAGETQRFLFNTSDNKSYEVRLVIDPGYTSNLIHIQRLH